MKVWNKAALLKLLWALAFKQDKLWVRWVNAYYIKRSTLMEVNLSNNISWMLKKIVASRRLLEDVGGWDAISTQQTFSIKKTYKLLRGNFVKVDWRRL